MKKKFSTNFNDLAEEIKSRPIIKEFLTPAKTGYVCIGCGNGLGEHGTGAVISKDNTRILCGKCGKGFSNIDVIAHHLGITTGGKDFMEVVKFGCQHFGIYFEDSDEKPVEFERLAEAKNNLETLAVQYPNKLWRGLPLTLLRHLNWGYLHSFYFTDAKKELPAFIIPNDKGGIFARAVKDKFYRNNKPTATTTIYFPTTDSFNVIITEGAINGASILHAFDNPNFGIIASGGTSGNKNVLERLHKLKAEDKKFRIIIAYDNDSNGAGQKSAADLLELLYSEGFTACIVDITKTPDQDLNDVLNANNGISKLSAMVNSALASAQVEFDKATAKLNKITLEKEKQLFGTNAMDYLDNDFDIFVENNKQFANRKTGFSNLDEELKNFQPGIYVLGGLPALGKTTFALQLLAQIATQGEHCIFVSYEMSAGFLYSKLLARETCKIETDNFSKSIINPNDNLRLHPLTSTKIANGTIYEHEKYYRQAKLNLRDNLKNFRIWEMTNHKIEDLIERLEAFGEKFKRPPVVVIDYIQIWAMNGDNPRTSIDVALRKIIDCRRQMNTTFIIISSLNRANYNTEISFEAFKETGGIEFSADVIWGLQVEIGKGEQRNHASINKAKKENPRLVQLQCLKNRFGANFDIGFKYYPVVDLYLPNLEYGSYTDTHINSDTNNNEDETP